MSQKREHRIITQQRLNKRVGEYKLEAPYVTAPCIYLRYIMEIVIAGQLTSDALSTVDAKHYMATINRVL